MSRGSGWWRSRTSPSTKIFSRAFPGQAADARGADDRGADAGRDRAAARSTRPARRPIHAAHAVHLRGVDGAKFRKHVVPGDQLKLTVTLGAIRGPLVRAARRRPKSTARPWSKPSCCWRCTPIADIDPLARVRADGGGRRGHHGRRLRGDRPERAHRHATARSARRRSSKATPRSATAPKCFRMRRSAWRRRT